MMKRVHVHIWRRERQKKSHISPSQAILFTFMHQERKREISIRKQPSLTMKDVLVHHFNLSQEWIYSTHWIKFWHWYLVHIFWVIFRRSKVLSSALTLVPNQNWTSLSVLSVKPIYESVWVPLKQFCILAPSHSKRYFSFQREHYWPY